MSGRHEINKRAIFPTPSDERREKRRHTTTARIEEKTRTRALLASRYSDGMARCWSLDLSPPVADDGKTPLLRQ